MKHLVICFLILIVTGCTSSKYCSLKDFNSTFDTLFVQANKNSVEKTEKNFNDIGKYIVNDCQTSGTRLYNTLATWYDAVSFEKTKERMDKYGVIISKQWNDGCRNTAKNFHTIGEYLCICGCEEEK